MWTAQYSTWGSTVREEWQSYDETGRPVQRPLQQSASQTLQLQQNLRMQGQYLDRETGLHYNTFRYYDADLGAFTTPDLIGLQGGINLHQYAPNPIFWIDPWGWAAKGYDVSGQTAGRDTVSRGAHVNVHGPGSLNGGGHVGFIPNTSGTGLIMTREDAATRNLTTNSGPRSKRLLRNIWTIRNKWTECRKLRKWVLITIQMEIALAKWLRCEI